MKRLMLSSMIMAFGSMGCGSAASDGSVALEVGLRASGASDDGARAIVAEDAQGTSMTLKTAVVRVRDIELELPDGRSCAELAGKLASNVRCDGSAGVEDETGDDRVTGETEAAGDKGGQNGGNVNRGGGGGGSETEVEHGTTAAEDGTHHDKLVIPGPFMIDLIKGSSEPSLETISIPAGSYRRVDVRLAQAESDDGSVLGRDTLRVTGTLGAAAQNLPFELRLRFNEDARFEAQNGIVLDAASGQALLLRLDVSQWFASAPFTQCLAEGKLSATDGELLIDDEQGSACSGIENELKDSIKNSGDLARH